MKQCFAIHEHNKYIVPKKNVWCKYIVAKDNKQSVTRLKKKKNLPEKCVCAINVSKINTNWINTLLYNAITFLHSVA